MRSRRSAVRDMVATFIRHWNHMYWTRDRATARRNKSMPQNVNNAGTTAQNKPISGADSYTLSHAHMWSQQLISTDRHCLHRLQRSHDPCEGHTLCIVYLLAFAANIFSAI